MAKKEKNKKNSKTKKPDIDEFTHSDDSAMAEDDSPSSIYFLHSFLLYSGRLLHLVLDFYNRLFDLNSQDKAKIYNNISTHYINKGLHDRALKYLKEWTRVDPSNPDANYKLAVTLAATGNSKSAVGVFNKVLKIKPNHKAALYKKSSILLRIKDFEGAAKSLEIASELISDNPKVYYLLGVSYEGLDEIDKAITALEKAVELDPEEIRYHQHLGFLNIRKDDHKTAAKSFTQSIISYTSSRASSISSELLASFRIFCKAPGSPPPLSPRGLCG